MNRSKRILFVNPRQWVTRPLYPERVYRRYSESAYVLPNTSIAYLAAHLEGLGYDVGILDAYALGLSVKETAERVRDIQPFAVCYNLFTQTFLSTLSWIKEIKRETGIPVIAGGLQVGLYPREVLTHREIDVGVTGEGWRTLPELLECLAAGGDLSRVRGICYREGEKFQATEDRPDTLSLDDVPFPARHLLPNDRYTTLLSREWPITVMLSALGCPFQCAYCDVPGKPYQARNPSRVAEEMEECERRFGIREILFQDETFTLDRERVLELCEEIRSRQLTVTWSIRSRPDLVDRQLIREMKKAGLNRINFGIESGSPEILDRLNRSIPLDTIRRAVRWAKEERITTLGFFIIGLPGETEKAVKKTLAFALELDCDFAQVNKFVPQPPSLFYQETVAATGVDYWREYTLGDAEVIDELPGIGSSIDRRTLDEWQRRFFKAYYYRPSYIWKRLQKVRSFRELMGLARAAFSIR